MITAEINSCVAVIGFVSGEEAAADPIKRTSNSAAICANKRVYGVYDKEHSQITEFLTKNGISRLGKGKRQYLRSAE